MGKDYRAKNLQELLDQIESVAEEEDSVSLESIMDAVGQRSFGPILIVAGLVILAPIIGDLPGVPTTMAILVLLVAVQVLVRRKRVWLPQWLLNRSIDSKKLEKGTGWLRKPARFVDKLLRPRMQKLTHKAGIYATAILCIIIALATPPMEVIPFTANAAGLALTALGLALIANDGVLAIGAFIVSAGSIGLVLYYLLF